MRASLLLYTFLLALAGLTAVQSARRQPARMETSLHDIVSHHARRLFRRLHQTLKKEIDQFQDPELGRHDENLVEFIRTLPSTVQEGHQESMEQLKQLVSTAINDDKMQGLKGLVRVPDLSPLFTSGMSLLQQSRQLGGGASGMSVGGRGIHQLRMQTINMESLANQWIQKNDEGQFAQAMYCLNAISEQTSRMDEQSQLEVVQRIISTMRTTTKGGLIPGADGNRRKLTDPEVRLVNEMTPEVLKLLNRLEKVLGKNPRVHLYIAEALGFSLGTQSFMSQASCLGQVNRMAKSIDLAVKQQPHMDSGMPHVIRGMFHLNVPPPLKSVTKARESFHRALKVNPHSGRNLYFCGLAAYLDGDYQGAVEYYKQAREHLHVEIRRDPQYAFLEPECVRGYQLALQMAAKQQKQQ